MRYKDENYNLEEYFNKVMEELGFTEGVEKVGGYYRDEAEYNVMTISAHAVLRRKKIWSL